MPSTLRDVQLELARVLTDLAPEKHDEASMSAMTEALLEDAGLQLSASERDDLILSAVADFVSFGPIATAIRDPEVTEVMVNGPYRIFVERRGKREQLDVSFPDDVAVRALIGRLLTVSPGHRVDAAVPFSDFSVPGGLRINVVVPPVVTGGGHLTIRKYARNMTTVEDLLRVGTVDRRLHTFLAAAIQGRLNVLYIGATGSGKTTLIDLYATLIDPGERIVVIEDTYEFRFDQPNVVRLLTRAPNIEGRGAITTSDLFRNALRMRPQRLILGEIRGREALEYLQAINAGHGGTLAVLHAGTPEEALVRIEHLVASSGIPVDPDVLRRQMAHGLDLVVLVAQQADGSRKVTRITEVGGVGDNGELEVFDLFRYEPITRSVDGKVIGRFLATGRVPAFLDRLRLNGVTLPEGLFNNGGEAR